MAKTPPGDELAPRRKKGREELACERALELITRLASGESAWPAGESVESLRVLDAALKREDARFERQLRAALTEQADLGTARGYSLRGLIELLRMNPSELHPSLREQAASSLRELAAQIVAATEKLKQIRRRSFTR